VKFVLRSFLLSVVMCIATSYFLHSQRKEFQKHNNNNLYNNNNNSNSNGKVLSTWQELSDAPWEHMVRFRESRQLLGTSTLDANDSASKNSKIIRRASNLEPAKIQQGETKMLSQPQPQKQRQEPQNEELLWKAEKELPASFAATEYPETRAPKELPQPKTQKQGKQRAKKKTSKAKTTTKTKTKTKMKTGVTEKKTKDGQKTEKKKVEKKEKGEKKDDGKNQTKTKIKTEKQPTSKDKDNNNKDNNNKDAGATSSPTVGGTFAATDAPTSSTTFFTTTLAPIMSEATRIAQCKKEHKDWLQQIDPTRIKQQKKRRLELEKATRLDAKLDEATSMFQTTSNYNDNDKNKQSSILVIASVPVDARHVIALWSELECFSASFDHVMIATAYWAKPIMASIIKEAKRTIPHLRSGRVTIEVGAYDNKKYDVGLWCDALMGIKDRYGRFALLNDSIFAIDRFDGILDAIGTKKQTDNTKDIPVPVSMTSLNFHENDDAGKPWVESVFRGFDAYGIDVFMEHSCVPIDHGSFCPKQLNKAKKKRCITDYFELGMSWQFPYPDQQVVGLFPGTVPNVFQKVMGTPFPTWVCNEQFWKHVLLPQGFPAAKVNCQPMLDAVTDPILDKCTMFLDRSFLCELNFASAERMIAYPTLEIKEKDLL